MQGSISLSERLRAVCRMVTPRNRVCDVGCDHGFVPIYLIQNESVPSCLAMDVVIGPLSQAIKHVSEAGLEEKITLRLSDGLERYEIGEADSLIIAGMGGPLMLHILQANIEKTNSFKELILQPQSEIADFRKTMEQMGYVSVAEDMILEDGKYYPMMKMVLGEKTSDTMKLSELDYKYGPLLLRDKHPVLLQFLEKEADNYRSILEQLKESEKSISRKAEMEALLELNQSARRFFD